MRVYVSADIEGIQGICARDSLFPGRFDYEAARELMTVAVLTVCEAAREAGATEVVVSDSHGNGQNIHFHRMPDYVQLVKSWPRPLGMMQGIETGKYAGALLIGYHSGATNPRGIMGHTMTGDFQEVRLNGLSVSEATISAAIAGHYDVPIRMIAGDDVVIEETCAVLGDDIASTQLKTYISQYSAVMLSPAESERRLRDGVRDALSKAGEATLYRIPGPITLDVRFQRSFMAEWLSYIDEVERLDAYTIRYQAADIISASHFITFLTTSRAVFS
jgi:D-amino peptidase